jgi:hypothetical protein
MERAFDDVELLLAGQPDEVDRVPRDADREVRVAPSAAGTVEAVSEMPSRASS